MKKFVVALGLGKLSTPQKIELGNTVVLAMTGNANFTTPSPPLAEITTATGDLETAYNNFQSAGGGTSLSAIVREKEEIFDEKLTALGNYVDGIAKGSETIILSAGMKTKKQSAPIGIPAMVENLNAKSGEQTGKIELRWSPVKGARTYIVHMSDDVNNPASYRIMGYPTASNFIAENLEAGKEFWFRIEAIGSAGVGHASDPAAAHAAF